MKTFLTLISPSLYLEFPQSWFGWLGWLLLSALAGYLLWRWRGYNTFTVPRPVWLLAGLAAATVITALFIGFRLPPGSASPPPGLPRETLSPPVMLLSAIPWMLAAGLLGPAPAAGLAFLSGLLQALFATHNPFYPVELALLAIVFAVAVRQNYRTWIFRVLRLPLAAAGLILALYGVIALVDMLIITRGVLATRLDYALTHLATFSLAVGLQLLVGALFAAIVRPALGKRWGQPGRLLPSPAESSLEARFLWVMTPLALLMIGALMVGNWIVAGNAAREMLHARMANATNLAAQTVPYFLETGENLAVQIAENSRLYAASPGERDELLQAELRSIPFFRQLYLFDGSGQLLAGYPMKNYLEASAPNEELLALQLALGGVETQSFSLPPASGEQAAQVGFVAAHLDAAGAVQGVLLTRSDLASNPLTQPALVSLASLAQVDGLGLLVDENGRILYHSDPTLVMTQYLNYANRGTQTNFADETAPDGTRRMVYYHRTEGRDWAVIMAVPTYQAQQLAFTIAAPLLGMIFILAVAGLIVLRLGLRIVTGSLQTLAQEAGRISQGQLDSPLAVSGEDEAGQLRRAFEQMRISLKARLDDLNRLLLVSQGVASSLDIAEAVQPVLDSALANGASSARVVLLPAVVPELDGGAPTPVAFGMGRAVDYAYLDEQILTLNRQQERLLLTNLSRPRLFQFPKNAPHPTALLAVALRRENQYFGTLWVAYDEPHLFSEEEVRFMVTLAGQAALAAANASLFMHAEIGRQRLAAILASTPDPVLVTDQHDHLLLANPAAWQALGVSIENGDARPIDQIVPHPGLVQILSARPQHQADETVSVEACLPDGRVYLATASSVLAEGQRVGRVCVMRDVTHFKELDALKSEFVSTVSHDLRSPLTLMRGYATMLEMVGALNEQQTNYVRKIVTGVESMSRLVNNLLDLGRIEAGVGLQVEMVPVHDVLERIVSGLQITASQKRIAMTVDIPRDHPGLIEADQALLQQALHNLVENAIKYTRPEGKVHMRMETRKESLVFTISDTGIGISPMDQARVFEKFYRAAQHGAREQRGTGLGLAIVKSIAERHGGRVWVESQLGKGSTFYLEVPIRQPR